MRKLLVVGLVGLGGLVSHVGCWSSSSTTPRPAPRPTPMETTSAGGQAYGAATYGGAGVLGAGGLTYGSAFASLTGTGDISSGFDDADIYGGLIGDETGDGAGGLGTTGSGTGGGGTGGGAIGTGRYGTIGHNSGTAGGGRGGMRGRSAKVPTVSIGQPSATGPLDKAIIRRYIKRNLQRIQYCYERELLSNPKLEGTVTVAFTIDGAGLVSQATSTGMPVVETCVAEVIRAIEFPKPIGGGVVNVRYPFTFTYAS